MSAKPRVLVTNLPFAHINPRPLQMLEDAGAEVVLNPLNRPLGEDEYAEMLGGFDYLLAGVEPVTGKVMDGEPNLQLIARIGIGIDNVDLLAARKRGIPVTHTPDGPSPATAELTIALMLDTARGVGQADRAIRAQGWKKMVGVRMAEATVGVIGVGRIGKRVIRHLTGGFPGVRILANDIEPDAEFGNELAIEWTDKETIYKTCDFVTLHVPRTALTLNLIGAKEFAMMKPSARLLNLARGGIVDEAALAHALRTGEITAAGIDVFGTEPYIGELAELENLTMTCHMAANTPDCRLAMESGAVAEIIRLIEGKPLGIPVAEIEYERAAGALK
ncbi:MAG: phosphoglycerate dehydrogenase [Rhodospirillales bacterium]|nr:phosphoglycerate dehydrogenase [Rhodospirillales bacterium]